MAELADALDSGSNGRKFVQVQVLLSAPRRLDFDFKVQFVFYQGFNDDFNDYYSNVALK